MRRDLEQILNSDLPLVLEYDRTYNKVDISDLANPCRKGIPAAISELAIRLKMGTGGVEKNPLKAFALYQEILKYQKNAVVLTWMGEICEEGGLGEEKKSDCAEYYEAASRLGCSSGSEHLGILYHAGQYVEKDCKKAKDCFQRAIQQGNIHAYFYLGNEYYDCLKQYDRAKECYEKATAKEPYAYVMLGTMYEEGQGVPQDGQKALEMYRLACKNGKQGLGYYRQGSLYHYGTLVAKDDKKALELFQEAVKFGEQEANYYIGVIYGEGIKGYLEPDLERALAYLSAVPEKFTVMADAARGKLLFSAGRLTEAKKFLERAVEQGSTLAQAFLWENFPDTRQESTKQESTKQESTKQESTKQESTKQESTKQESTKQESTKQRITIEDLQHFSAQELQKLYMQGNMDAAFFLADCYKNGTKGVQQDITRAISLLEEVTKSDGSRTFSADAYAVLAAIYKYGESVPVDYDKAFQYAQKAAEAGHTKGKMALADMYQRGQGVQENLTKAFLLLKEVADSNTVKEEIEVSSWAVAEAFFNARGVEKDVPAGCRYLLKCYKINPDNEWANYMLGQFYQTGVKDNGEEIIPVDAEAAQKCLWKVNTGQALYMLGEMYESGKIVPARKTTAMMYYELAAKKGHITALYHIAAVQLLPDAQEELWYNPQDGIQKAKIFLEKSGNSTLKASMICIMEGYFLSVINKSGYQQSVLQEYEYLLDKIGSMGLTYSDEKSKQRMRIMLGNLISSMAACYLKLYESDRQLSLQKIENMLRKMENYGERNKYIKEGASEEIAEQYLQLGKTYLNTELYKAQEMIQKAAENGSVEAEKLLKKFRTNLLGKLVFK